MTSTLRTEVYDEHTQGVHKKMAMSTRTVIVSKVVVAGFHNWPDAPEAYRYLSYPHRHQFVIRAALPVEGENRQVEFIGFGQQLLAYIWAHTDARFNHVDFGARSCEMIARELVEAFKLDWCSVYEDDENGAIVSQV